MSKPMRLDPALQRMAEIEGKMERRSPPKQIEYWADLGRQISQFITPRDVHAVFTGAASINISYNRSKPVAAAAVLRDLEKDRASGRLAATVTAADVIYGLDPGGRGVVRHTVSEDAGEPGQFVDGRFVPATKTE